MLVGVAVLGYLVALVLRNGAGTQVDLILGEPLSLPLWAAMAGGVGLGVLLAVLGFSWPMIRGRMRLRRQSQRIAQLEQEIHGLRNLPITDEKDATLVRAREA